MLKKYEESIEICDKILDIYPNNSDVLYDKATNLILLGKTENCLKVLNLTIQISKKFKVKAKNSKSFHVLHKNPDFIKLIK